MGTFVATCKLDLDLDLQQLGGFLVAELCGSPLSLWCDRLARNLMAAQISLPRREERRELASEANPRCW